MSDYDFGEIARIVATRNNIQNYKLELHYSSNKGDGYTGSVRAATMIGTNKQLNLVFKYSARDPKIHESLPLKQIYTIEIAFYEQIAPAYKQFQEEHNIKEPFDNNAIYYGSINEPLNECIVMENLKCLNYDLWDRKKEMNTAHLETALKAFGKFHGTSMAMKHLNPELHQRLVKLLDNAPTVADFVKTSGIFRQISETILTFDKFDPKTENIYQERLDHFRLNIDEIMKPAYTFHDKYDAIIQGDCWCNNAMYLYEDLNDRSKPIGVKLLDWQGATFGSVIIDLSYFFYSIAAKESMDNLDHFLKIYYDSLSGHLKAFGLDADNVYPFKVFLEHWQKNALFGLMMAFVIRKIALVEVEDAPDFSEGTESLMNDISINSDKEKLYKQRMKNIIKHFVDRNII